MNKKWAAKIKGWREITAKWGTPNYEVEPKDKEAAEGLFDRIEKCGKGFILECVTHAPYDGCHWENNYFYVEMKKKEVHRIFVTHQRYKWEESVKLEDFIEGVVLGRKYDWGNFDGFNPIELENASEHIDVHYWCHLSCFSEVVGAEGWEFEYFCKRCQQMRDEPAKQVGYTGNGGVGITITDVVCLDCYCGNNCEDCGEYIDSDEGSYHDEEHGGIRCEYCQEKHFDTKCFKCGEKLKELFLEQPLCEDCAKGILEKFCGEELFEAENVTECKECGEVKLNQENNLRKGGWCDKCRSRL